MLLGRPPIVGVDGENFEERVDVLDRVDGITLVQGRELRRHDGADDRRNVRVLDEAGNFRVEVEVEARLDYLPLEKKLV